MADSASSEPEFRAAISRIYYGLHHESCCRYFRREISPAPLNRNRRHTELTDRFKISSDPAGAGISVRLNNLRMMRSEADYQLVLPLRYIGRSYSVERILERSVSIGEELLELLEEYSPGEAPDGCECRVGYSSG